MLDVSNKIRTLRTAAAQATLKLSPTTITLIEQGKIPKGDPLEVAKVAGIQAAKNTSQVIPYCHPLPIDFVGVEYAIKENAIEVTVTVKAIYRTGVEMEALTAASVAALTLYDMMKMLDDSMEIVSVKLLSKTGGKSDFKEPLERPLRAAVLVISDSIAAGKNDDSSGRLIVERLKSEGIEICDFKIISDDPEGIIKVLVDYADTMKLDLVISTGGTGCGPRDNTSEATMKVIEREIPGIAETARAFGQERTPFSMLSRGKAGVRGSTVIINLPGSEKGAAESLDAILPGLFHLFRTLHGGGHPSVKKKP